MNVLGIMSQEELVKRNKEIFLGCEIVITHLSGEDGTYDGKSGIVEYVDDMGDLHGTWGFLAVIPGQDRFRVVSRPKN